MKLVKRPLFFVLVILTLTNYSCSSSDGSTKESALLAQKENYIKDISAATLYDPLEKKGFKIDKQIGADVIFVDCDRSMPNFSEHVRISGDEPSKINEVRASYTNYSTGNINELAKPFLSFIATLPYENANPEQAKKWIEANISKNTKLEISGVIFELIGNSKNIRILIITPSK